MSYLYTLDFSKLKKFYWKNFLGSNDAISYLEHVYYNQKKTYHSNSKIVFKISNFKNYGVQTVTVKGHNLKSKSGKYSSYEEFIPKLGSLLITSNKGISESQAVSILTFDSWALKQNFIIKASKYNTNYVYGKGIHTYGNKIKFSGNNLFLGSSVSDKVFAGNGSDKLYGKNGNDKLYGESGNDKLIGNQGNDLLVGGLGNDKLIGGSGKDIFKLSKGKGYDLIQDFKNNKDKILIGSIKKINLKNKGKDVLIYSGKDLLAKVKKAKGLLSKKGQYLV